MGGKRIKRKEYKRNKRETCFVVVVMKMTRGERFPF